MELLKNITVNRLDERIIDSRLIGASMQYVKEYIGVQQVAAVGNWI